MTVRCCYYGIYAELKTSRTPTNPRRMFWGCQKYSSGNGCGFFRWADANDLTCQEQYNIKNPSSSSGQARQGRQLLAVAALATLVPATTFEVAALVPATTFFYKHILKSKVLDLPLHHSQQDPLHLH
ncbi:hypothetical protein H5410_052547 [Solanum commersonii]|uniref:GRF-type domain-containing protein n=1 Tax=Solanum commersonii TaxID=4109 RepID=A0A9J5X4E8_SOLCO|nr:hypothetical protein H5410_052547 [Solanum commersonii]